MLTPLKFTPFTANEIKPSGWLRSQLLIQANGLSGNLDKIWSAVKNSKWIGGDDDGWESVPYWLDGFIPLAYLLDDDDKKARAKKYIDAIIDRQRPDGFIAPCAKDEDKTYDVWAYFLICKVLTVYADCSGDERIEEVLYRALYRLNLHIEQHTLFDWGSARWFECLIPLAWLYERRAEDWMSDMVQKLCIEGFDWEKLISGWRYSEGREKNRWSFVNHVVNIAMMLKSSALMSRFTGENPQIFAEKAISLILRDHGTAAGHFNGDECLAGKSPVRGSECCSVAEAMYSYEWLVSVTGNPYWAERLEKNAFNSFPATLAPDMWSHQYDQQANKINCCATETDKVPFGTNNGEAHTFGLMPHCSCCLANHNQAWPKFALNIFQKSENGFAVTAIAPAKLTAEVNGAKISAELITDYPFEDGYRLKIRSDSAVSLDITLRVPEKATNAQIDGERADTGFNTVRCNMNGEKEISVSFDFDIELNSRDNDLFSVSRGNLTFALPIEGRWEKREYIRKGVERKFPYCDYDLSPLSKWNYALYGKNFTLERSPVGDVPFSPEGAPLKIKARFVPIDWKIENGMCTEVPGGRTPLGEPETLFMIPYGCTNLRMTEMPLKAQGADSRRPV